MKKLFGILFVLMLAVLMIVPASVFAADPTVTITTITDRLNSSVSGSFGSGTVNYNFNATAPTYVATTNADVLGGNLQISSAGKDITTWHPGIIGQTNDVVAQGGYTATVVNNSSGTYGIMSTFVNAASKPGGADITMTDMQDFNIMSANHTNNVVGQFQAYAAGTDDQVAMNLKSVGSMYVWSEATNGGPGLRGSQIGKLAVVNVGGTPTAGMSMDVNTSGVATIQNSNIWGWGVSESGQATTNYNGGTRSLTATGTGLYTQLASGTSLLNFNGGTSGGGNASLIWNFAGGLNQPYNMDAK